MKLTLSKDHKLPTNVLGLALTPDGSKAYAACLDGSIFEVETASGNTSPFLSTHQSYASGCVLLPDGKTLISGGYDGYLIWHDVESRRSWRRVQAHQFWNWQLAMSPDGTLVATTTGQYRAGGWKYEPASEQEPSVKVFDTKTGDLVAAFGHTPPVLSCAFSPDGKHLAAANMMGEVRVWKIPAEADGRAVAAWTSPDFTSWGTTKTHHYCGGIYGLSFSPDSTALLCCGMGPMGDPMAGNGKMTWQRWAWAAGKRIDQIKDGQHGSGLMETVDWHPSGKHFVMAGRQAQGTWNAAIFSSADGALAHSIDTKMRITRALFTADGSSLVVSGGTGQPRPKEGRWPEWGRVQIYKFEAPSEGA